MLNSSTHRLRWASGIVALLASVSMVIWGCAIGSGSSAGTSISGSSTTSTATATHVSGSAPTATPRPAPPHAFAWYQRDSHNTAQIWASINGAAPRQITHIPATPPPNTCTTNENSWGPPVFSPDLTHIIAAQGAPQCGGGTIAQGPPYLISSSTGSATIVPFPNVTGQYIYAVPALMRGAGWLNNSTVWFTTFSTFYTYHLGDAHSVELPGFSTIGQSGDLTDAVVRGSTLFFEYTVSGSTHWTFSLRRYNLSTHTMIPGSISLGTAGSSFYTGLPGQSLSPGWDVSPDGSHIVYQVVTQSGTGIGGTKVYYASANGSGATRIATALYTAHLMYMQFSPNGQWVAFTNALPSPSTLSASVTTAGGSGDPTFHGYSPDTTSYPVWKWDSGEFWAQASGGLYHYMRGGSSGLGVAGGLNPWYTIGS